MSSNWRNRPKPITHWPEGVDHIVFIDESGDSTLKHVLKARTTNDTIADGDKYFTVAACVVHVEDFESVKQKVMDVKLKHWEDGFFRYKGNIEKRVCFHSSEIRGKKGPFSESVIDWGDFANDINEMIKSVEVTIFSSSIDKLAFVKQYINPVHPYELCLTFVLERIVNFYLRNDETCILILEGRGKKEDKDLLNRIKQTMKQGTSYVEQEKFNKIKGVYFNSKWCSQSDNKKTYFCLEISDLCSHPIHYFTSRKIKNKPFEIVEEKIYKFPNYIGKGLKIFP